MQTKILALAEAKLDGDGPGRMSGYASVWGGVDSYGDTIIQGAYKNTIPQFLRDGFIPWSHNWCGYPVATPDKAREDGTGLFIEAVFHTDAESQRARQIVSERLARGKTMGLSIGYQAKSFDFTEMDGMPVRRLTEIELMEVSLVMVPADAAARVTDIKARRRLSRHQLEAVIATLQALMGEDDETDDEAAAASDDGKAAPVAGDDALPADGGTQGDATPPSIIALDTAGAALLDGLASYVTRLKAAPADEMLTARPQMAGLLRLLSSTRIDLDALMARADVLGETAPRELLAHFRRLDGLYGPTHSSRQAG